jgi:hypothetical protein
VLKHHHSGQKNRALPDRRLDRNYEEVSGVSPIKTRHPVDLLGFKCGGGQFNPIMVENVNKLPEEHVTRDPVRMSPEERQKRGYKDTALKFKEPIQINN